MIYVYGDNKLFKNKFDNLDIKNYMIPYASNEYVFRKISEHVYENIYTDKDIIIIGLTNKHLEERYNEHLGLMTCSAYNNLIVYDNGDKPQIYYCKDDEESSYLFNDLKKEYLYDELNKINHEFMNEYKSNIFYNYLTKALYVASLDLMLQNENIHYLFVDKSLRNLSKMFFQYKYHLDQNIFIDEYEQLKNNTQKYITYKQLFDMDLQQLC